MSAGPMVRSTGPAASLSRTAAVARASAAGGAPAWWPTTRCRSLSTSVPRTWYLCRTLAAFISRRKSSSGRPAPASESAGHPISTNALSRTEKVLIAKCCPWLVKGTGWSGPEAADTDPQRGGPGQDVHHPRQVHLPPHARVREQVRVDDGAGLRVAHAVERDQRGVHLLERIGAEIVPDVLRDQGLHPGQELAQLARLGPVEGHGRNETASHARDGTDGRLRT